MWDIFLENQTELTTPLKQLNFRCCDLIKRRRETELQQKQCFFPTMRKCDCYKYEHVEGNFGSFPRYAAFRRVCNLNPLLNQIRIVPCCAELSHIPCNLKWIDMRNVICTFRAGPRRSAGCAHTLGAPLKARTRHHETESSRLLRLRTATECTLERFLRPSSAHIHAAINIENYMWIAAAFDTHSNWPPIRWAAQLLGYWAIGLRVTACSGANRSPSTAHPGGAKLQAAKSRSSVGITRWGSAKMWSIAGECWVFCMCQAEITKSFKFTAWFSKSTFVQFALLFVALFVCLHYVVGCTNIFIYFCLKWPKQI